MSSGRRVAAADTGGTAARGSPRRGAVSLRTTGRDAPRVSGRASAKDSGRGKKTRRSGSYRRLVTAGDVALGLGVTVGAPAVRMTTRAFRTAEQVSTRVGAALFESLPIESQETLRHRSSTLAQAGRDARMDTVDALVGTVVAEVMTSDVVRAALTSAVGQAMDEVVDAAMPSVVEQLRTEIAPIRLEEMVRASVERVVPEVIERDLSNAIAIAIGIPGRTARGLARLPTTVLRPSLAEDGYDE